MATAIGTVVVPGFGGTALSFAGGRGGKTQLWVNPTNILRYTPLAMGLAANGVDPYPLVGKKLFPDGPVQLGIYEPLMTQLATDKLAPVFWGYDWRVDPRTTAEKLATYLVNNALADPFYVVAHSFGGLIAQLAYPRYLALGGVAKWATTVYLGTPHGGAYSAAANLGGMYSAGDWLVYLADIYKTLAKQTPTKGVTVSAAGLLLSQTTGNWPGLYSLLPSNLGPWQGLDADAAELLKVDTYKNGPGNVRQTFLDLALAVQQQIVAGLATPRPAEVCFVGDSIQTLSALLNPIAISYSRAWARDGAGDGTVLVSRGTLPGAGIAVFNNTGHTSLPNTLGPASALANALKNPWKNEQLKENIVLQFTPIDNPTPIKFPPIPALPFVNAFMDP